METKNLALLPRKRFMGGIFYFSLQIWLFPSRQIAIGVPESHQEKRLFLFPFTNGGKMGGGKIFPGNGENMPSLRASEKNSRGLIAMLCNWRHSGFQVFCGQRIFPQDDTAMDNLARYTLRASLSQERMLYLAESPIKEGKMLFSMLTVFADLINCTWR